MPQRGHELANHCVEDIPYHTFSEENFEAALLDCQGRIDEFILTRSSRRHQQAVKWFRPPQGRCSGKMERVLERHGYRIAMCDVFGLDVMCGEPFVSSYVLRHAREGSIILMHMAERGFREHNLAAIERVLEGLKARGIRCISLSEMEAVSNAKFC